MRPLERSNKSRFQHEAITTQVEEIERIYSGSNIDISGSQNLKSLLCDARDIADQWSNGNLETDMNKLFRTLHVERIYSGIRLLVSEKIKKGTCVIY